MVTQQFFVALLIGVLLALPYVAHARRSKHPAVVFGIGLLVAALIYVIFAVAAANGRAALIEVGGVLFFGVLVALGLRWSAHWLAAGWLAHVAWDLLLHPVEFSSYAPWWYPVLCISFDLVVAGFVLATFWAHETAGKTRV